jgi:hypothetical protein
MSIATHDSAGQAASARGWWLEFALVLLVFFIHGGAPAPQMNETYYLAKAKHYWDPAWCAGDLFLESADAHLAFYWTVGWLAKFFSLPTVAWIGRVAAWAFLAWSWQRLCCTVMRKPFNAVLGAALLVWLTSEHDFAGEWLVGGVEGKCFAYACVFAALAALAKERWNQAWPWFGLAGAFHVLVGGWAALAAGCVWLFERREERPALASMTPALALAFLLTLPGLIPALQLSSGVSAETSREAGQIYVFERLPHHLAPLSQDSAVVLKRVMKFSLPLLAFVLLWWLATKSNGQDRSIDIALNRICRFAAWSFIFSFAALNWEIVCSDHLALAASLLRFYWFRLADVAVPMAAAFLVCYWIERLLRDESRYAPLALSIALALAGWHLASTTLDRWQDPTPPADRKLAAPAAWRETCEWIRDHTPADAICLVPRASQSLSWYANRKSLVTWKDVPQDAASIVAWRDRYFDVFWHDDEFGEHVPYDSLAEQGTSRIRELAAKYGVDFVVTREYPPLGFPIAYANAWYAVYAVSPAAQESLK